MTITNVEIASTLKALDGCLLSVPWHREMASQSTSVLRWIDGLGITERRGHKARVLTVSIEEALDIIASSEYQPSDPQQEKSPWWRGCDPLAAIAITMLRHAKRQARAGDLAAYLWLATDGRVWERAMSRFDDVEWWVIRNRPPEVPSDLLEIILYGGEMRIVSNGRVITIAHTRDRITATYQRGDEVREYELHHITLALLIEAL